jgi:hypothetical protein
MKSYQSKSNLQGFATITGGKYTKEICPRHKIGIFLLQKSAAFSDSSPCSMNYRKSISHEGATK